MKIYVILEMLFNGLKPRIDKIFSEVEIALCYVTEKNYGENSSINIVEYDSTNKIIERLPELVYIEPFEMIESGSNIPSGIHKPSPKAYIVFNGNGTVRRIFQTAYQAGKHIASNGDLELGYNVFEIIQPTGEKIK